MGHQYAGNAASFPADFTIPDDGDPRNAASVDIAFEALGDRTAHLKSRADYLTSPTTVAFTSTSATPWTAGTNDHLVELEIVGGGGGGGGGGAGLNTTTGYSSGGGGGGAAHRRRFRVSITPGTTYESLAGLAGTAGVGGVYSGAAATDGGDGGPSVFRVQGGSTIVSSPGAKGGKHGDVTNNAAFFLSPGGSPTDQRRPISAAPWTDAAVDLCFGPGFGGEGSTSQSGQVTRKGADSADGYAGGAGGAAGANAGGYHGGGPGGGGAAGPFGIGAAGGTGGAANAGGAGSTGGASSLPGSPGYAGGGGGGGGGGSGSTAGGDGGAGSPGVSGYILLRVIG